MTDFVINLLDFLSNELIVFVISMVPLIELRGSIPVGLVFGIEPLRTFILTYPASLIPAPFIILFIHQVFKLLEKNKFFARLIDRIVHSNRRKHSEKIEKYGYIGLFIIVAIPLPGTGVWSGSLAAAIFEMDFKKSMVAIILGNLVAAILILIISMGVISFI
ncbi:COG2426 family protein [Liberiplasma polymorphum]|uniref:COG2426 family protein n=1 Tax=Liberiplasma polymorphum TaxID=3374570 RepID=UPI0037766C38